MPLLLDIHDAERSDVRAVPIDRWPVRIGSAEECEVRLDDDAMPPLWLSLEDAQDDWVVVDHGAELRALVDGAPLGREKRRIVRHGSVMTAGRRWRVRLRDEATALPDIAQANTAELALRMAGQAVRWGKGTGSSPTVRVVEGAEFGTCLPLVEEGRDYLVGRAKSCDLPLADADASREHARIVRRGTRVLLRDLGSTGGVWLGTKRLDAHRDAVWPRGRAVRVGQTVLLLVPSADEFFEESSDEVLREAEALGVMRQAEEEEAVLSEKSPTDAATEAQAAPTDAATEARADSAKEQPRTTTSFASPTSRVLHFTILGTAGLFAALALVATIWVLTR